MPPVELWLAILLVVVVDVLAALALLWIRRRAPEGSYFADSQRAAGAFAVTGTIFAVLVGFVFLLSFQSYQNARSSAKDESIAAVGLFNSAQRFAALDRAALQADAVCYARAVVGIEWPAMADERSSPVVDAWVARLNDGFNRVTPHGAAEGDAAQNWFTETDALLHGRQGRLAEASRVIPTTIWVLLLLSGAAVVSLAIMFADPSERRLAQLAMLIAVTTAVAASLLTVNFLDRPYGDHAGAVTPVAMRSALATMDREDGAATRAAVLARCDQRGQPIS
jgi:ABC-type multidrug transport system fused ATPase/permease subunit